jgi:hypothetical protein
MKLTAKACEAAKPDKKPYKMFDGGGLYLEVKPPNSKLWRLKYRYLGKEKKLSIGEYPAISLAEAREHRDEAKKLLASGHDPSAVKQEIKQEKILEQANTFEAIAREWHEHKKPEWSEVNAKTVMDRLERDVFPEIGKYPIKIITHKMLLDLANSVKRRGANELAKRIIQMCRHVYSYAIVTGRAQNNIAEDLKGMIRAKPKSHFAAIEAKDLPQFMADLRSHKAKLNRQTYLAVKRLVAFAVKLDVPCFCFEYSSAMAVSFPLVCFTVSPFLGFVIFEQQEIRYVVPALAGSGLLCKEMIPAQGFQNGLY